MTKEEAIEKIKRWKLEIDDEKDYADYLEGWFYKDDEIAFDMAIEALKERKTGQWISKGMSINCSVCHKCSWSICFEDTVRRFNYCPNCGAKMKVQDD